MGKFNYKFDENTIKNANELSLRRKFEIALTGAQLIVQDSDNVAVVSSYFYELFKMRILAVDILKMDKCELTLTEDQFDELDRLDIIGKINVVRKKKDKSYLADKAKSIMADYNEVIAMLDTEIENELRRRNDIITRLYKEVEGNITPEMIKNISKTMVEVANSVDEKAGK